jgi:hypothetical protein
MNTYTIILKRVSTGKQALSMVTRPKDGCARLRRGGDRTVAGPAEIHTRTSEAFMGPGRDHRAPHLISRYGRELT